MRLLSITFAMLCIATSSLFAAEIRIPASADGEIKSAGVLGVTATTDQERVRVFRSGGSNIQHGVFIFDVSDFANDRTDGDLFLEFTTAQLISNTSDTALVNFHGFTSDDMIESSDFNDPTATTGTDGSLLTAHTFPAGASQSPAIDTTLLIPIENEQPFWDAVEADGNFMVRAETVNFVTFHVHSLENTVGAEVPTLVFQPAAVVPEPAGLSLGVLGLSLTALAYRKRRTGS